ncbi:hypothetical protein LCM28_05665 [Salipiger pacificus]|nr:hypothetical protein [Alloyangia pacifica]
MDLNEMPTYQPDKLNDADIRKLEWSGTQDRYKDPKSPVYAVRNKGGVSFGMVLNSSGKSKWHSLGKFREGYGIAQARKDAMAKQVEVEQHGLVPPAPTVTHTFAMAFEKLERRHKRLNRSPRTIAGYRYSVKTYTPDLWDTPLADIRRGWLREKHDDLADTVGRSTAINWLRSVSPVLTEAVQYEWIESNPALGIKVEPATTRVIEVSEDEIKAVWPKIDAISNVWMRSAWRLALLTGLRKSDIASARWEHFDRRARTLFIPEPKGGPKRAFLLPLCREVVADLSALPKLAGDCAPWIFPAPRSASGHIYDHRQKKLPNPHWTRHAWNTAAQLAGVDMERRSVLLNQHYEPGNVNRIYSHLKATDCRAEAEAVAAFLLSLR